MKHRKVYRLTNVHLKKNEDFNWNTFQKQNYHLIQHNEVLPEPTVNEIAVTQFSELENWEKDSANYRSHLHHDHNLIVATQERNDAYETFFEKL